MDDLAVVVEFPAEAKKNFFLFSKSLDSSKNLLPLSFPTKGMVFAFITSISRALYSAHSFFLIPLYQYLINTKNYATHCYTGLTSLLSLPSSEVPIQSSVLRLQESQNIYSTTKQSMYKRDTKARFGVAVENQ
jgi:hypothetical protein